MKNNSVLSQMWKSAHLIVFWVVTLIVSKFRIVHNGQSFSYSAASCMGYSILKCWHHISCKCNFSLLNRNYPNQDENNIQNDKPWVPSNRFRYRPPPPSALTSPLDVIARLTLQATIIRFSNKATLEACRTWRSIHSLWRNLANSTWVHLGLFVRKMKL
jgi:hypothetical protein